MFMLWSQHPTISLDIFIGMMSLFSRIGVVLETKMRVKLHLIIIYIIHITRYNMRWRFFVFAYIFRLSA